MIKELLYAETFHRFILSFTPSFRGVTFLLYFFVIKYEECVFNFTVQHRFFYY